jgi:hypothetical protein
MGTDTSHRSLSQGESELPWKLQKSHLYEGTAGLVVVWSRSYRRAREAYHCFLFSVGYFARFGVHPSLQVQIKEEIDYDAILTWRNGSEAQKM